MRSTTTLDGENEYSFLNLHCPSPVLTYFNQQECFYFQVRRRTNIRQRSLGHFQLYHMCHVQPTQVTYAQQRADDKQPESVMSFTCPRGVRACSQAASFTSKAYHQCFIE